MFFHKKLIWTIAALKCALVFPWINRRGYHCIALQTTLPNSATNVMMPRYDMRDVSFDALISIKGEWPQKRSNADLQK